MDINALGLEDAARFHGYLGDHESSAEAEPSKIRIRGRDPEDGFEGTLYASHTRVCGPSLAAASYRNLPKIPMSKWLGPDSTFALQAMADVADTVESEESDFFIPMSFRSLRTGIIHQKCMKSNEWTGFSQGGTVDKVLSATTWTELMTYTVPKTYEACLGWAFNPPAQPLKNYFETFITLQDMTGFKTATTDDKVLGTSSFTDLCYYEVKRGYEAFLGHLNLSTSYGYSLIKDDTTTAVEEPGYIRLLASDAEDNGSITLHQSHQDQWNVSSVDGGQNLLLVPRPEVRIPTDSRLWVQFKPIAADTVQGDLSAMSLPITLVKTGAGV